MRSLGIAFLLLFFITTASGALAVDGTMICLLKTSGPSACHGSDNFNASSETMSGTTPAIDPCLETTGLEREAPAPGCDDCGDCPSGCCTTSHFGFSLVLNGVEPRMPQARDSKQRHLKVQELPAQLEPSSPFRPPILLSLRA